MRRCGFGRGHRRIVSFVGGVPVGVPGVDVLVVDDGDWGMVGGRVARAVGIQIIVLRQHVGQVSWRVNRVLRVWNAARSGGWVPVGSRRVGDG